MQPDRTTLIAPIGLIGKEILKKLYLVFLTNNLLSLEIKFFNKFRISNKILSKSDDYII